MRHDDTTVALEAAHIKWKQHGGPCEIPNGLALCAIHHKAFDKGSIGLDENMRVLVSDAVNGGGIVERLFWDFDGKTIALPQVRKNYPLRGLWSGIEKRFLGGEVAIIYLSPRILNVIDKVFSDTESSIYEYIATNQF